MTSKDLKQLYDELNKSEKFGVKFGLFPGRLDLTTPECVELMKIAEESK